MKIICVATTILACLSFSLSVSGGGRVTRQRPIPLQGIAVAAKLRMSKNRLDINLHCNLSPSRCHEPAGGSDAPPNMQEKETFRSVSFLFHVHCVYWNISPAVTFTAALANNSVSPSVSYTTNLPATALPVVEAVFIDTRAMFGPRALWFRQYSDGVRAPDGTNSIRFCHGTKKGHR